MLVTDRVWLPKISIIGHVAGIAAALGSQTATILSIATPFAAVLLIALKVWTCISHRRAAELSSSNGTTSHQRTIKMTRPWPSPKSQVQAQHGHDYLCVLNSIPWTQLQQSTRSPPCTEYERKTLKTYDMQPRQGCSRNQRETRRHNPKWRQQMARFS